MIIAGLGNPGKKYEGTRHNIGFEAVNLFAKESGFSEFKLSKKLNSLISKKNNILLLKPQTFMNKSGEAVREAADYYDTSYSEIIIIHDDIDLKTGRIKISKGKGSAGHKGIESIISHLKTKNFTRIRIGISPEKKPENTEKFVLQKFNKEEKEILEKSLNEVSQEILNRA